MDKVSNTDKGRIGEEIARRYILKKGYKVLKTNWFCRYGEIDLITILKGKLIFFEVKYVTQTNFCFAVELFSIKKRMHLYRTTSYFVKKYPVVFEKWQLDLICITKDKGCLWIDHYKNVLVHF